MTPLEANNVISEHTGKVFCYSISMDFIYPILEEYSLSLELHSFYHKYDAVLYWNAIIASDFPNKKAEYRSTMRDANEAVAIAAARAIIELGDLNEMS